MIDFNVISSSALAPGLASKYSEIKSYIIKAINDERVQGRIDVTYQGFHAMIQKGADLVFIDPALDKNTINYIVYKKTDLVRTNNFACLVNDESEKESLNFDSNDIRVSDNNFITYRIAISCTGEYAQFHGGTIEMVVSAMNTTINRVNFVYEHDFAVRFEIVDKNDTLIYLNPSTDPYDNNDVGTQLDENQNQCDEKISSGRVGRLFPTTQPMPVCEQSFLIMRIHWQWDSIGAQRRSPNYAVTKTSWSPATWKRSMHSQIRSRN